MRLRGRELLWSLTRHFVNMLLYSDISEPGGWCSAPTATKGLADLPFLRPWERYQGEGLHHPQQDRSQECWWKHRSLWNTSGRAWFSSWTTLPRPREGWGPVTVTVWRDFRCTERSTETSPLIFTTALWRRCTCMVPWPLASISPFFLPKLRAAAVVQADDVPTKQIWTPGFLAAVGDHIP